MTVLAKKNTNSSAENEQSQVLDFPEKKSLDTGYTQKQLFRLWVPLFITWALMGLEMPIAHTMITRLPEAKLNLAALGISLTTFIVIESPIFSMLSAATVLVEDWKSYIKLRNFNFCLGGGLSLFLALLCCPLPFNFLTRNILALPENIIDLVWASLMVYIPAPFCVGYRRFYQGLLVHFGMNFRVGLGTVGRMIITIVSMFVLAIFDLPGAVVGAGGCIIGVSFEAIFSRILAKPALDMFKQIREFSVGELRYSYISRFYIPLALTGIIGTAATPLLNFFLSHGSHPIESLAVYPVLSGFAAFFVAALISTHDLVLATLGDNNQNQPQLSKFNFKVIVITTIVMLFVIICPPINAILFNHIYKLPPELVAFAKDAIWFVALLMLCHDIVFWARAMLIHARITTIVTVSSVFELISIACCMPLLLAYTSLSGVSAAFLTLIIGRLAGWSCLIFKYKQATLGVPNKK